MRSKNHLLATEWIEKANKDLEVTEILLKKKNRYLDLASFHCQQAFEKYLKGFIVNNGILPNKTHDLEKLLNQAIKYNFTLIKFLDAAQEISPFAVIPRYPDEIFDVAIGKVRSLIKKTKRLGEVIKDFIEK